MMVMTNTDGNDYSWWRSCWCQCNIH